jgi:hypothetical protein
VSWFTALALALLAALLPPGGTFVDDDGNVHEGSIEAIAAEKITLGCNPPTNDLYCPGEVVTRGQMAAFFVRALDLPFTDEDHFRDDDNSIFEGAINRLAEAGITKGCNPPTNDEFCPGGAITRGQMAAMLARAFGYPVSHDDRFIDDDGSIFETAIQTIAAQGVTVGCNPPTNDRFCPHDEVTRDMMATFLTRALGLEANKPPPRLAPLPGNPSGNYPVPAAAREVDTSHPDHVIGNGTPQSCTSQEVVDAVAQGGIITFDCGPNPHTIVMTQTARVFNDTGPEIVIDGGGLVTLSGGGDRRILYMNTCDPDLVWTTPHCQDQDHPRLTVQSLAFRDGYDAGEANTDGGGAIWVRGGRFKIVNSVFYGNRCSPVGTDVGGAAVRVFSQHNGQPVYVTNSTFGGSPSFANICSNGGAISSIGVSWTILNSVFTYNEAIGRGANGGNPGGGNGGAIYNDGNEMTLRIAGTRIENNHANEGGGGVFFVSNNRTGNLSVEDSVLRNNPSDEFENYPGIFYLGDGPPQFSDSIVE